MTTGNSSPLSDGASAVVLASVARARELGRPPLARVVAADGVGIAKAGLTPQEVDVYEVHEAFAAQAPRRAAQPQRLSGRAGPSVR